jgi:polyisoprenoid-binding protein YceI
MVDGIQTRGGAIMNNQTQQNTTVFDIDPSHSTVEFKVRHLGFSKVTGRFTKFSGTVDMQDDDLSTLSADVTIDASSITTGDEKRDQHLRSEDFFQVDEHPELSFRAENVKDASGDSFVIVGDLTMRGITERVEIEGDFLGTATDPWGGSRVGFQGSTKVNRKNFGLNWNQALEAGGFLVGDTVEIMLDVQAVRRDED